MDIIQKSMILKLIDHKKLKNINDVFLNEISEYFIENLKNIIEMLILIVKHRKISSNNWEYDKSINQQHNGAIILESDVLLLLKIIDGFKFKGKTHLLDSKSVYDIKIDLKDIKLLILPKSRFSQILVKIKKLIIDDYNTIKFTLTSEILIQYIIERIILEHPYLK